MTHAAAPFPRIRDDLVVRRHHAPDGDYVVVKDPESNQFFRFGEVEYFIAEQLDGYTTLDAVRQRAEQRFGSPLREETLRGFLRNLERTGLLAGGKRRHRRSGEGKRIRGDLFYLRFPILDPARLLDRLLKPARPLFTPHFIGVANSVILLASILLALNWGALAQEVPTLLQLTSIPMFMGVLFLLIVAHEFAHGLTCRYFGGEVREMGFMLLYFQPALYCNVSDAWLFPEKRQRLWVGFAGPYFELFLWALTFLLWWATVPGTWIHYLALIIVTGSGIKTLFNFNPLIKLDGYYLLSDYLDLPNLRKKSFQYVGQWVKTILGVLDRPTEAVTRREGRIFVTYGVLATVYSFSLLLFIAVQWGGLLLDQGQPVLFAAVMGLVGTRFGRRVRGILGPGKVTDDLGPIAGRGRLREWLLGKEAEPRSGRPSGDRPPPKPRDTATRRQRNRRRAWLAGLAAFLAVVFVGRMQLRVAGPVSVLPDENADVRAAVEGIVQAIYVDEGQQVKAGQVIARLSADALVTELRTTEEGIREARANLQKLEVGPRPAEIAVAKAAVVTAEGRLEYARNRLGTIKQLFQQQAATRPEYEQAEELATTAENELSEARTRLNVLLAGSRPEEIAAARAKLAQLEARQAHLQDQVAKLDVYSPVDGVVATPSRELRAMQRQLVAKGDLIAKVFDFRTVTAQIRIAEKEMADIRVGQRVEMRARAYPSREFRGTVTAIGTAAEGAPAPAETSAASGQPAAGGGDRTFIVTTRIANDSLLLKPGMTGRAKVYGGSRPIISLITRRLARTFKVELWSWW